jgi:hypothetical protein
MVNAVVRSTHWVGKIWDIYVSEERVSASEAKPPSTVHRGCSGFLGDNGVTAPCMAVTFLFRPIAQTRDGYGGTGLNSCMSDNFDDIAEFLERRLADLPDRGNGPEREILDALIEWTEAGCLAPAISVTFDADRFVTVENSPSRPRLCPSTLRCRKNRTTSINAVTVE